MALIATVQLAPSVVDREGNQPQALQAIAEALEQGADIVVLPELTTSGYVFETAAEVRAAAVPADSPLLLEWAAAAGARPGAVVVGGFAELGADGLVYNSSAIVDATGVIATYRKVHLWDREKLFFTAGSSTPPVVDTAHGRLSTMVCFDVEFPEWTRLIALQGAEVLCVPTNWPRAPRPDGERVAEVQTAMTAARLNRMAIVCADRTGRERGVDWNEGSSIISADGWVLAEVGAGSGIAYAEVDAAASRSKSLGGLSDAFADRRPDLYGPVAAP